jgi:hypothetical protein
MAKSSPQPVSYLVQPPLWPDLVALALQARATTNAPGAAIALINGSAGEIVCYARSGSMAPELGTASLVDDSLTAQCVRIGKQLQCHDAGTDTRVCSAAAAELAARSLVVTPIQHGSQVLGVLAVFSNTADAFSPIHLVKLKTIADQVIVILLAQQDQQSTMADQGPLQLLKKTSDAPQPDTSRPKPPQSAQLPLLGKEVKREPLPPVQIVPASEHSSEQLPAAPVAVTHSFATLNAVAGQKKESAITHRILAVAAGLLVVAGSATWASWKRAEPSRVDATSIQIQAAQQVTPPTEMPPQSTEPASQADASAQPLKTTEQQPSSDAAVGLPRKTDLPRKRTEAARGTATPEERSVAAPAQSVDTVDLASHKDPALLSATKEPTPIAGAADVALPTPVANAPPTVLPQFQLHRSRRRHQSRHHCSRATLCPPAWSAECLRSTRHSRCK